MGTTRNIFFFFCLVSFFFGYLTYYQMFPLFSPLLWVFIPDCPLYVGCLLVIALLGIRSGLFRFLTAAGMMKYGAWTLMIFALYPGVYFAEPLFWQTMVLVVGHILMVLGSFIIVPGRPGYKIMVPVLAWMLLNDFMDYWIGTLPRFPPEHLGFVIPATIALSLLSVVVLYLLNGLRNLNISKGVRRELGVQG